jgi:hypothetical protein
LWLCFGLLLLIFGQVLYTDFLILFLCIRKVAEDDDNDSDEETKRNKMVI